MIGRLLIISTVLSAFFAVNVSADNGAFEELLRNPSVSGYAAAPGALTAAKTGSTAISVEPDGDTKVHMWRQAPPDMKILPDDDIREELPDSKEIIPIPAGRNAGALKMYNAADIDPQNIIPSDLKAAAVAYYTANKDKLGNLRYLGVVNFSRHSSIARFYIADITEGTVRSFHVAHGSGSDPDKDGYATIFSNKPNSNASSLGFYLTGDIYTGKHGRSMRLHGLSATNSNAFERAVVIHKAKYVSDNDVQPGRSWGCLAVSLASIDIVIETLKGGALIYAGLSGAAQISQ
ncbi:MAG: hypothetical protein A2270_04125 [Elusimicrobia bacterium RIFOXYA12_FULL_51_18]|nr:MAG: hypothetical protein A2270_04125 [Elusimicrobia bacterium RIFOXYA12_FULL_51_18]OGS30096.1 MAG: hypothetical protein A2218_13200 [Elusimicrobia bacterium RIFOXYA2_FULL_53_38]